MFGKPSPFGATSQTSQRSGLFGKPQTGASPFGQTQNSTATFGQPQNNASTFGQPQNTATFGQSNTSAPFGQNQTPSFGQNNQAAQNPQPAQNTSTFGQSQPSNTLGSLGQPAQNATSGFSFGQTKPAGTGFSFGGASQPGTTSNQPNSTASGGGLFGGQQSGFSFGQPSQGLGQGLGQQPSTGGLFNNPATATATQPQLTAMTRVSELPEPMQKEIENLNNFIQQQVAIADNLKSNETQQKDLVDSVPRDVNFLETKFNSVNQALITDLKFIETFKPKVLEAFNDWVEKVLKLYLQLTNPEQNTQQSSNLITVSNATSILNQFYVSKIEEITKTTKRYEGVLSEIETAIQDLDNSSTPLNNNGIELVLSTLREEYYLYMELANNLAEVHHNVRRIAGNGESF